MGERSISGRPPGRLAGRGSLAAGASGSSGSVIALEARDYGLLVEQVTEARVAALFAHRKPSAVKRYLLPKLGAMNFVIDDVLDGGVNGSLNLDTHGKTLAFLLLDMPITVSGDKP